MAKPLRSTDLRHKLKVRRAVEVQNGRGGYTDSWTDVAAPYAEVTGLNGREAVMDKVLQGVSFYQVRIRWRDGLLVSDQMQSAGSCFGGRPVNIRSIVDPDGRREQLVILADTEATLPS